MDKFKCCICGKEVIGWGNDPWPVVMDEGAKCCDECDMTVVLGARLDQLYGGEKDADM